ncbi:LOB domain-containing protein 22-like [Prosopis cineraria]|uniref:LOB domain-containing protein 22-like n=1 Tax=Prosopis cineraria TaxID=364024 RepID=UPI00240FB174|nr:LOB domain-containing protein 22-like [Prosopis cineraria]
MNLSHTSNTNNNVNTSNNQACAACKYRRRKCTPDCILAPYFPYDRPRQFLNAHKLFGVRNITKIIESLEPCDKDQAMRTIIYQSDMRANDPVGGCFRYIQELEAQIHFHKAKLDLVLQHLDVFRTQAHRHYHCHHSHHININMDNLDLCNPNDNNIASPLPPGCYHHQSPQQQDPYMMVQEHHNNDVVPNLRDDVNSWAVQESMSLSLHNKKGNDESGYVGDELYNNDQKSSSSMLEIQCHDRNDIGFEPEELVERSDEVISFKIENAVVNEEVNCIQQAQDHDLKGAATLFALTNCTS